MAKKRKGTNQGKKQQVATQEVPFEALQRALRWIINENIFSQLTLHGNVSWTAGPLVVLAVLWVWSDQATLTGAFAHAKHLALSMLGEVAVTTYQGLANALVSWTGCLLPLIQQRLQDLMEQTGGDYWRIGGWLPLAVDGSRIEAPHTADNQAGLGCAGREKTAPQVFLTTLWHMGVGLPWDFRVGPGTDSERRHLEQMLPGLPPQALLVADAGFVGYQLCRRILQAGHSFLLRVGSNVQLLTQLGYHLEERDGLVYLWPEKFHRQPPLVLRLIVLGRAKQTIYLVTNVLDAAELSDQDAGMLYEMRWGVEVFYRSFKQTLDRRTLLSRTPQTCLAEVQATLLGLWLLGLLSVSRLVARGVDPLRWSVAKARDVVRRAMRQQHTGRRPRRRRRPWNLDHALTHAIRDQYVRRAPKAARNYPRKKRERPPRPPKIQPATTRQIRLANALKQKLALAA